MKRRFDALCPNCGSLERHRLAKLVFEKIPKDFDLLILHVAPEHWLRNRSVQYLSIDLCRPAMKKMDITNLQVDNEWFILICCSNVLKHFQENRKAMCKMFLVLKPGGIALVQVPIWKANETYENDEIKTSSDRLELFYQEDHVRLY